MFTVYACLANDHDYRLVGLAAVVCLFSSLTAINALRRLATTQGRQRLAWLAAAAVVTGVGVWSTHFIAMLAFKPNLRTGYDLTLTVVSLLAAIVLIGGAFQISFYRRLPAAAAIGGALVGAAIGVMHYLGMAAFEIEGRILWNSTLVIWSVALGTVFGALALSVARRKTGAAHQVGAALLLTLAICGLHFTAMGAAAVLPDPTIQIEKGSLPDRWLALWVANGALVLLVFSLGAMVLERRQRRAEKRRLHELANAAVEGLVVCDEGVIITANLAFERLVDEAGEQIIGRRLTDLVGEVDFAHRLAGREEARFETLLRSGAGEQIPVELIARLMPYNGALRLGVAVRDLRASRAAEARIRFLAHHDPLTGLPNRTSFNDRLEKELQRHRRKEDSFAVLCLDLDRFKQVNDVFGHAAGDEVLKTVSTRIADVLDEEDVLARLGGDEFAIIRVGACRPSDLAQLSERILQAVVPEITLDGHSTLVGVSLGIALYPSNGDTASALIRNADAALYRAKDDGRGAYRFFEAEIGAQLRERQVMEFDLRHAIARGELSVMYQPQTSISTQEIFGFEALLRWTHGERGSVSPDVFIPIAEETGLILPIGEWVLREACREAASWAKPLQVAVNLSGVQLHSANLPTLVHEILLETGLPASRLELEITETALIQDFNHALHALRQIKALGVKIAMDDFGTGYSSLSNLRAFPFDKIKIDQSFVRDVHRNGQAAAIVRAIVGLARGLDLVVLAEGVESREELVFLSQEFCTEAQGYYFGRPADIGEFSAVLTDPNITIHRPSEPSAAVA